MVMEEVQAASGNLLSALDANSIVWPELTVQSKQQTPDDKISTASDTDFRVSEKKCRPWVMKKLVLVALSTKNLRTVPEAAQRYRFNTQQAAGSSSLRIRTLVYYVAHNVIRNKDKTSYDSAARILLTREVLQCSLCRHLLTWPVRIAPL